MIFQQDFTADFATITAGLAPDYSGPPYAFSRFADGESAIIHGREHLAKSDGWHWPAGKKSLLTTTLRDSLACCLPGWNVGITAEAHHPAEHGELLKRIRVPLSQVTFAEIFIFGNHGKFLSLDFMQSNCTFAGPSNLCGKFKIPPDAMATDWLWHDFTRKLIEEATGPILLAAGPLANAIIYDYWRWTEPPGERHKRRVILDVGSAIAHLMHGRNIRRWQRDDHPQASWRPGWKALRAADGEASEKALTVSAGGA